MYRRTGPAGAVEVWLRCGLDMVGFRIRQLFSSLVFLTFMLLLLCTASAIRGLLVNAA